MNNSIVLLSIAPKPSPQTIAGLGLVRSTMIVKFEWEIIRERTKAGLVLARARGRKDGRPKGLTKEAQVKAVAAISLYQQKKSVSEICATLSISKKDFFKYLRTATNI